jgi:hypothetical protein
MIAYFIKEALGSLFLVAVGLHHLKSRLYQERSKQWAISLQQPESLMLSVAVSETFGVVLQY